MKKKIVIQIPCLNEESTIGKVIKGLKKSLSNIEIIVYDNSSTDNTIKEAKKHGAKVFLEKKKGKGNVVIVSSAASSVKGAPNRFIYGVTKAALNGFIKALAIDYVKQGIRCNGILPGTVETPSWQGRVNMAEDPKKAKEDFIARQAMGRLAQPEEIASLATYLASDESDFVTGTLNLIDGGWTL